MSTNGLNTSGDTDMAECDGEKVVTMMDVLQEQQDFEEDANAVLGASDDKNCTYTKGYIKRQALYACMTCCSDAKIDPSKRAGVCLACSLACHENHELIELYTKRNFRCDCGNPKFNSHPCQFNPNKTELNEDNKYNQNYSGLYCICQRPYPDPESTVEDEMIQCIVCEDWLHASHLDAVVPSNDLYSEMICKNCMEKNEFLHDYSSIAVTADSVDVDVSSDITMSNGSTSNSLETPKEIKEQINTTEAIPECEDKGDTDVEMNDQTKITDQNGKTEKSNILNDEEKNQNETNSTDKEEQKDESDTSDRKLLSEVNQNELTLENDKGESSTLSTNMEESLKDKEEITKLDTDMEENIKENENSNEIVKENIVSKPMLKETQEKKDISNSPNSSCTIVNSASDKNISENENIVCDTKEDKNKEKEEEIVNKIEDEISETNDKEINEDAKDTDDNTAEELKRELNPVLEEVRSQDVDKTCEIVDKTTCEVEDKTTCEVEDKTTSEVEDKTTCEAEDETTTTTTALTTNKEKTKEEITADEQMTAKMEEDLLNEDDDAVVTDKKYEDNLNESTKPQSPSKHSPAINDIEKPENSELTMDHSDITQNTTDLKDENKTDDSEHKTESDTTNTALQDTGPENSTPVNEPEKEVISTESTKTSEVIDDNSLCPDNDDKTENITQVNEISEENKTDEKVNDHKVSDESEINHSNIENEVPNEIELGSANENKRKLSTGETKEDFVAKKIKLEEVKTCVRPKGVKRQFKGATFWPSNFRQKLCTCNECLSMYKDLCVLFLIDPEDTVTAYETLGMEKTQGKPSSQYEKGLQALSSLDRIQQINALTEYNKMRDKLLDFLKSFKDRKEIVKEEDIKAFFAGMKPKREPDGVYFCR
ncbi:unnamed protein product [Parnassius apollo]|uniref:(apollo) hypothetical protein n=1 Tax=Parnassius apollo TaxID=110799 RepID=A0A8S3W0Y7_PARAO|nr:unnamed protein product [Parnassius apollo]